MRHPVGDPVRLVWGFDVVGWGVDPSMLELLVRSCAAVDLEVGGCARCSGRNC